MGKDEFWGAHSSTEPLTLWDRKRERGLLSQCTKECENSKFEPSLIGGYEEGLIVKAGEYNIFYLITC